ncbi:SAF domain-containing protein [Demequina sp. NBRC 110051]|uniref:SAF domain-containing protein n=1 Tax=Demequina sp. NBRC 110051 TaxID=1570340 RepID=UPI0009FC4B2F|nr:SAF domain-containing protein [Demequina sp. NBRC 110051]
MNDAGPIAGRLKRPSWRDPRLLIGIALVAASVVAVAGIVRAADATEPFYAAKGTLTPGTVLAADDLMVAHVNVGSAAYLDATQEPPVGSVVTRAVGAGELVPAAALVSADAVDVRPVPVATSLPLDAGIVPGSVVDVWLTTVDEAGAASTVLLGESLVVTEVADAEGAFAVDSDQVVYVAVPEDEVAAFLQAVAGGGDLAVLGLGGTP